VFNSAVASGAPPIRAPPSIEQILCLRNRFEFPILAAAEAIEAVRETERLQRVEERLAKIEACLSG
jgi:hypothetical protein